MMDCRPPVDLPESSLDVDQIVRALAADRTSLVDCRASKAALVEAVKAR